MSDDGNATELPVLAEGWEYVVVLKHNAVRTRPTTDVVSIWNPSDGRLFSREKAPRTCFPPTHAVGSRVRWNGFNWRVSSVAAQQGGGRWLLSLESQRSSDHLTTSAWEDECESLPEPRNALGSAVRYRGQLWRVAGMTQEGGGPYLLSLEPSPRRPRVNALDGDCEPVPEEEQSASDHGLRQAVAMLQECKRVFRSTCSTAEEEQVQCAEAERRLGETIRAYVRS